MNGPQQMVHKDFLKQTNETIARYREALEHIADQASTRDCCKYAVLAGRRRRHLKELARVALQSEKDGTK